MAKEMGLDRAPIEFQTFYFSHVLVVPPIDYVRISNVPGHFVPPLVFMIVKNLFSPKLAPLTPLPSFYIWEGAKLKQNIASQVALCSKPTVAVYEDDSLLIR